jgi:hypothetical protein
VCPLIDAAPDQYSMNTDGTFDDMTSECGDGEGDGDESVAGCAMRIVWPLARDRSAQISFAL